ncbi:MAG: hypothetical protein IKE81_05960 [Clostridia bacterium]|nr:hypothetical protein [Clostridia bacterium]
MKSNVIIIDNMGNGFGKAIEETRKVSVYEELNHKDTIHLQLCAEEMMSLARSVTGEMKASFWIETESGLFDLHLSTKTKMDAEKRKQLLGAATSGQNEAAGSFLGFLRNAFESAMAVNVDHSDELEDLPSDVLDDFANHTIECTDAEWDGYEQSTLRRLADCIKIGIRGDMVDMTVSKRFA